MKIYIISSFKNFDINLKITQKLEKEGYWTYLPQRDTPQDIKEITVKLNKKAIKNSDCVVVVGLGYGSHYGKACCWEMGYANGLGKKVVCLGNLEEDDFQNRLNISTFFKSTKDLVDFLKDYESFTKNRI